jgi:hypothetical protein
MRRLMRQKAKIRRVLFKQLNTRESTFKVSQKPMTYETLLLCFYLSHKRAFLRHVYWKPSQKWFDKLHGWYARKEIASNHKR